MQGYVSGAQMKLRVRSQEGERSWCGEVCGQEGSSGAAILPG